MSQLGQSRHFAKPVGTSASPLISDVFDADQLFRVVSTPNSCTAANTSRLFEQYVGSSQERLWNREAHCLGSLQVDSQLKFRCR